MRFIQKVAIYLLTFVGLMPIFQLSAQENSNVSSSLMCMYSPFDGLGKITTETTSIGINHVGYAYAELTGWKGDKTEAYGQFFWEQKFWDRPIFLHTEYRGVAAGSFYESTAYLGAAYCIYSKHGYLALEPLAMWKQGMGLGGQFSIVGGWEWKHFIIEHYTDIWKTHKMSTAMDIYSQTRLFVKINKRLSAGVIGTIFNHPENSVSEEIYLALRWNL